MTQIVTTDHGPHPASTWATIMAKQIIDIDHLDGDKLTQASLLQARIATALEPIVEQAQHTEHLSLMTDPQFILSDLVTDVTEALNAVKVVTDSSQWAAHFAMEAVRAVIAGILHSGIASAQNVERLWYCDRNPADPNVLAFKGN